MTFAPAKATRYTADADGLIQADADHVAALVSAGCIKDDI